MKRRQFLARTAGASAWLASAASGLVSATGDESRKEEILHPKGKAEHCVFVWLGGGASHVDMWDPKTLGDGKKVPGSAYPSVETAVPGVRVAEPLSQCARRLDRFALLRGMHHDVVDEHAAATNRLHTGRPTSGTVIYPSIGSIVSHQRGSLEPGIPPYVVMGYPNVTRGPGFLGARHGYVYLTDTQAGPAGLRRPDFISLERQARREALLAEARAGFLSRHPDERILIDYDASVGESQRLARGDFMKAFNLAEEPDSLRAKYGSEFGQRCLLARRLAQRGVRFLEVSFNLNFINGTGWDTHNEGHKNQHLLIRDLDRSLAALVDDLEAHRMLDRTLIVVATEFGRPPDFDNGGGRGHQSKAFSVALAGGGLRLGQAIGETDELGRTIVSRPVSVPDLHATIHCALGIKPDKFLHDDDRPVPITDRGQPVRELFSAS
ncbi:MAG: DUF1501 domain-containing protein [Verrucomicrobia bacterium]|nr:DUF1501 domain-containing protein [Verrucomicrobiota bacterium]